ncbi:MULTISPECIES: DUF2953 domain-containing protein [unclassified Paenibacillus]|uniref:DUF2953 domain-containing protein n=1 Tax=unclassified Paenibacillus TaxID=185978 RepID=UPI00240712E4|nr:MULTISPECIES: DUF2953 domain-containing protein [unclassified Paenibacillus]MDF9840377.1 hypothetical protein [Paenibacillus sp. PastF-2]MDF9846959.1 hypothetical protein [Paenibacillus sp. PastM-2]MDF9853531.1 hypothetical protein [Paenibacillus sp. PastF-1]MDH6478983.1 hypothetical protein [Paenibacillus sp. PastH-2]MDH6506715.1 hypothetical protein [Paenibacillus sp. PastM-3]
MTLWLVIPLALLLLAIVLVLSSSIHFHFRLNRIGKDDRVEFDIKALFGLVKFHFELPKLVYEGIARGVKVKLEESGIKPVRQESDSEDQIDKEKLQVWKEELKEALKATRGLRKWMKALMSHVRITRFDWSTDFSLGDAASTAIATGVVSGLKWGLVGWMSQMVRLQRSPRMFVVPVFRDELCFSTEAVCTGKLNVAYVLYSGLQLLRRIAKVEGGLARWKRLLKHEG